MIRKNSDIRELFESADSSVQINQKKKHHTLEQIRQKTEEKNISIVYSRKEILKNQIQYMDKTIVWIQMMVCIAMILFMFILQKKEMEREDMIAVSMVLSGILGIVSIAVISSAFFSDMAELGETCFFNIRQMVIFHMVYAGVFNLMLLFGIILFVGLKWKITLMQIGLYSMVPYVFTECCCLGTALTNMGRRNPYLFILVGIFDTVFYILLASYPPLYLYETSALAFWGMAFLAGILCFAAEIKSLWSELEKGEILCTD